MLPLNWPCLCSVHTIFRKNPADNNSNLSAQIFQKDSLFDTLIYRFSDLGCKTVGLEIVFVEPLNPTDVNGLSNYINPFALLSNGLQAGLSSWILMREAHQLVSCLSLTDCRGGDSKVVCWSSCGPLNTLLQCKHWIITLVCAGDRYYFVFNGSPSLTKVSDRLQFTIGECPPPPTPGLNLSRN